MERSGVHPLRLSLDFYKITKSDTETQISSVIDVLARSCSRWEDVVWKTPVDTFSLDALLRYNGSFPALQKVQITFRRYPSRLLNLFRCSTSLHTLSITLSRLLGDDVRSIDLPWNQIKRLQISTYHPSPVLSLLTKFPRLETLDLSSRPDDEVHLHHTSHTIKSLALTIKYYLSEDDARAMLEHFTIPNLTVLEIEEQCQPKYTRSWGSSIADFLTRSGCSLTSLRLNTASLCDQQLIALLELTPTLTTLEIKERYGVVPRSTPLTGTFLRHFVITHQREAPHPGRIFLPRLSGVVFWAMEKEGLADQDFFDFVASRWIPDPDRARDIGVECLRSVEIELWKRSSTTNDSESERRLSSLECFRDAGLWVNTFYG
ncbi:hypothetical protein PQX77_016691 [Marasmius sp. AFHP31]|nr:hypothetical protein PQX77_016691 [Marasmius sp. AFHP31]